MGLELKLVAIDKPADVNVILGQSHFIKTVEDLYEALVGSVPGIKFGLAFCEASGACLVRVEGTDEADEGRGGRRRAGDRRRPQLRDRPEGRLPGQRAERGEGRARRCAGSTAPPRTRSQVVVAETEQGRGILGVVDGSSPKGVEDAAGVAWRQELLQKFGYKR